MPNAAQTLEHFATQLMARQYDIYAAEWQLEADPDADKRAAVLALITAQLQFHGLCQHPDLTAALKAVADTNPHQSELARLHAAAKHVPLSLLENVVGAAVASLQAWHAARHANSFTHAAGAFGTLITLQRQWALLRAEGLSDYYNRPLTPYEALIDQFDAGRTLGFIKTEFAKLQRVCTQILAKAPAVRPATLTAPHNLAAQAALAKKLVADIGVQADDAGPVRIVSSAHPFCRRVAPQRVMFSTKFNDDLLGSILTTIHEAGHARYYQNLPTDLAQDWLGGVASESVNEGMALLAEHVYCRTPEFAAYLAPLLQESLGINLGAEQIFAQLSFAGRDALRATAGEACYPLHLIHRTMLEEELINNGAAPNDLPDLWHQLSTSIIGIEPTDDAKGCLQDIQLFAGYIGYFPCYLLGHMAAAQLASVMQAPTTGAAHGWLQQNLYPAARQERTDSLMTRLTGQEFTAAALCQHLQTRYLQ